MSNVPKGTSGGKSIVVLLFERAERPLHVEIWGGILYWRARLFDLESGQVERVINEEKLEKEKQK